VVVQYNRKTSVLTLTKDDKTHTLNKDDSFRYSPDNEYMVYLYVENGFSRILSTDTSPKEISIHHLYDQIHIKKVLGLSPKLIDMCLNFDTIEINPNSDSGKSQSDNITTKTLTLNTTKGFIYEPGQ
jgi:hypothetical protein